MKSHIFLTFLTVLFLSACNNTFEVGIEHSPDSAATVSAIPVVVASPTGTAISPTSTNPPSALPRDLVYSSKDSNDKFQIYRLGRDGTTITQLTFEQNDTRYEEPSLESLDLTHFDLSPTDGRIVYSTKNELVTVDSNGANRQVLVDGQNSAIDSPIWSPDGQTIAYRFDWRDVYLFSLATGKSVLLVAGGLTDDFIPVIFSPDGKKLILWDLPASFPGPVHNFTQIFDISSGTMTPVAESGGYSVCTGTATWISQDSFFCYYRLSAVQNTRSGLWRVNAKDGSVEALLAPPADDSTQPIPLVVAPHQDAAGNLYYLYSEGYALNVGGRNQTLSLMRSDVDGVTNRVTLRPEKFLVDDAVWTPDGSAVLILQDLPNKSLLLVPVDPSLPVVTLPAIMPPSDEFYVDEITMRWEPETVSTGPISQPTATPAPVVIETPTDSPAGTQMVQIYLIALEDNGVSGPLVGCGDSAVAVQVEIPQTQGVLRAALESLLSIKTQYYGESGLYNALYQSDLQVESVKIEAGKASVYLTGTLLLGGECDNPRVQAQLEETVRQFPTVSKVAIFINGKPLADALSLRGFASGYFSSTDVKRTNG